MGNQPSTQQPSEGGSAQHVRSPSLRHRPHNRRPRPTLVSSRSEPYHEPGLSTPEYASPPSSTPKSPDLTPLSPTSLLSPSLHRIKHGHDRGQTPRALEADPVGRGAMGNSQSNEQWRERDTRRRDRGYDAHSSPVQVPVGNSSHRIREPSAHYDHEAASPGSATYAPRSNLNFPPRLPLPIQEEVHTPGSPIITPDDLSRALEDEGEEGELPHRASLLSHTTAGEDDEEIEHEADVHKGQTVPTEIRWRGTADKVYVTGSFAAWSRKFRMHRDPKDTQSLSTTLELLPGTHHIKFIVDGDMQLSDQLPTAVDFTNILVNYIEVSADDIPHDAPGSEQAPTGLHPPQVVPPGIEEHDFATHPEEGSNDPAPHDDKRYIKTTTVHYSDEIPQYLPDLDRHESTNRFQRSANHINDIPPPPSLPLFLGKSILNSTTPTKDDSSVLNMPNHTVLNHLATSSIKNDVLATSLTTRYRRKYVTTITYRPTREDD